MSTLPRRLRTMERLRNIYDNVTFVTTNDSVTATFKYDGDADICRCARGCAKFISPFKLMFTMKEFDNLFA